MPHHRLKRMACVIVEDYTFDNVRRAPGFAALRGGLKGSWIAWVMISVSTASILQPPSDPAAMIRVHPLTAHSNTGHRLFSHHA
jgi:hypothetical protein